ncbi:OVARIAN TUMOR DOMAIN-containing deubiquitinating enzyme 2-like [Impatiens glandulifera]|uniref:OVARIAN TUMOR DOMAIN-containing deubiquitinating enzyme 2-like n=1 Tax=Impatiens glandulifera TaxID=253017 RepID=UPI001FB09E56|nr:OVARIAN TUMOR DOMAIN-containing deubiquitinating enzyme 2-like [Impatiens glandulifera]
MKNPVFHGRSKYIDTLFHFIHEYVENRQNNVEFVSTREQRANILTKALARVKFAEMRELLNSKNLETNQDYGGDYKVYDIQITRCDLYGQEKNNRQRVMLIYDGLHYDALAMSPAEGALEEFDQTIFLVYKDRTIGAVEKLALNFVKEQQRKRSFTNTANFTLRCGVCQIGVICHKEAVDHAHATGHANFQEYK